MNENEANRGVSGPGTHPGRPLVIGIIISAILAVGSVILFRESSGVDPIAARVPASAMSYLQVTLQPSLSQKRLAQDLSGVLPGGKTQLEAAIAQGVETILSTVEVVTYEQVKPWLGDELAIAEWSQSEDVAVTTVFVAHAKDSALAQATVDQINQGQEAFASIESSFVTIAQDKSIHDAFQRATHNAPLVRDKGFRSARARVGGDGIMLARSDLDALSVIRSQASIAQTGEPTKGHDGEAPRPQDSGSIVGGVRLVDGGLEMTITEGSGFLEGPLPLATDLSLLAELAQNAHAAIGFNDLAALLRTAINAAPEGQVDDLGSRVGLDIEEDVLSWLAGQTAMRVAVFQGDEIHGSLVVEASDEAAMKSFVQTVHALLTLSSGDSDMKIEGTKDHFTVTSKDLTVEVTVDGSRLSVEVSTPNAKKSITDAGELLGIPEGTAAFAGAFNLSVFTNIFGADFPTDGPFAGYGQAIKSIGFSAIADEDGPRIHVTAIFKEDK